MAISLSHLSYIKHTTAISIDTQIMIILYVSSKISTRQNLSLHLTLSASWIFGTSKARWKIKADMWKKKSLYISTMKWKLM